MKTASIAASQSIYLEPKATCPSGKMLLGGGATTDEFGLLFYNGPEETGGNAINSWLAVYYFYNEGTTTLNVRVDAYAYCAYVK